MRAAPSLLLALALSCAPAPAPLVTAPSAPAGSSPHGTSDPPSSYPGAPKACDQSWALEDVVASDARVLVVCPGDVRREPPRPGAMAKALDPGLDAARRRVCDCAARLPRPAFVDLVVTAIPEEGRASLETGEPDESVDHDVAAPFVACVGKVDVTFPAFPAAECPGAPKTTYVYSLDVELAH